MQRGGGLFSLEGNGVRIRQNLPAKAARVYLRELRAQEHDLGEIVDPQKKNRESRPAQ